MAIMLVYQHWFELDATKKVSGEQAAASRMLDIAFRDGQHEIIRGAIALARRIGYEYSIAEIDPVS